MEHTPMTRPDAKIVHALEKHPFLWRLYKVIIVPTVIALAIGVCISLWLGMPDVIRTGNNGLTLDESLRKLMMYLLATFLVVIPFVFQIGAIVMFVQWVRKGNRYFTDIHR